jgi:Domain of unknown function (DUF4142)
VPTRRATRGARGPCDCRGGFVSFALHQGKPVKQFGAHRVEDQGRANDELKQLASAKGVSLPTAWDGKNQKVLDRLPTLEQHMTMARAAQKK